MDAWALVQTIAWIVVVLVVIPLLRRSMSNSIEALGQDVRAHVTKAMEAPAIQATATASKMEAQVSEFSRVVAIFDSTSRYFIDANTALRSDKQALNVKVENLESSLASLEQRLKTHAKTIDDLTGDLQQRAEMSKQNAQQISDLTNKVNGLDDALKGTKTELQTTQDELELTRRELEKTKADLASAQRRITDLEAQRDTERATAAQEKAALETALNAERAKVTELETKVKTLEAQVKDLQAQLDAQKPTAVENDPDSTRPIPGLFSTAQTSQPPEVPKP